MPRLTRRQARAKRLVHAFLAFKKAHINFTKLQANKRVQGGTSTSPQEDLVDPSLLGNDLWSHLDDVSALGGYCSNSSTSSLSTPSNSSSDQSESSTLDFSDNCSDELFEDSDGSTSDGMSITSLESSASEDSDIAGMPDLMDLDSSDFDSDSDDDNSDTNTTLSDNDSDNDSSWDADFEDWEDSNELPASSATRRISQRVIARLEAMYAHRYEEPRERFPRGPASLPHVVQVLKHKRPNHFRQELRVSPYTFDSLVKEIINDPVFANNSQNEQIPVEDQLAIYLYRLGHHGNSVGLDKVAKWAGYSKGTITLVTRRVMTALLRPGFLAQNIRPPTRAEKEKAKEWVEEHSCRDWRDGWCMVDGTLVPIYNRPYWYGESYFDRKCNYSLNIQIISLPNLCIIDIGYGFTGSTHDASAWQRTRFFQEHQQYLQGSEFIWADSAYPLEEWLIAPYKSPEREQEDNEIFNNHLSMIRIRSEHAIGFLKGRFQSLKGLRIDIRAEDSHKFATYWVLASIAVHNFAIAREEEERARSSDEESDPFIAEGLSPHEHSDPGRNHVSSWYEGAFTGSRRLRRAKARREELKARLLQAIKHRQEHRHESSDEED